MTDTSTPTPPPAGGAAAPTTAPLAIAAQYVRDLSFENPNAPSTLAPGAAPPQVAVNVDVRTNALPSSQYEVILNIRGEAKSGEQTAFIVELSYAGVVSIGAQVSKEHTAPLLLIEVPRMLFPFARAVIAEATRNGGFPPLLVQPIDFAELFRRQLSALRQRQAASDGGDGGQADGSAEAETQSADEDKPTVN